MKIILRDDDVSYFSNPEYLEEIYKNIWNKITIQISIIPKIYVHQKETPIIKNYKKDFYWIGENTKLKKFLIEKIKENKITLIQHGFTHKDIIIGKKFELESKNKKNLYYNILKGKKYLEKTFGQKIDTIVAPHNRFSKESIAIIENLGFKYINRGSLTYPKEFKFNKFYLKNFFKLTKFYAKYGKKYVYPNILDFGNHKEIYSYNINKINKYNINDILSLHSNGILSIFFHHRTFSLVDKEKINYILKYF